MNTLETPEQLLRAALDNQERPDVAQMYAQIAIVMCLRSIGGWLFGVMLTMGLLAVVITALRA